MTQKALTNLGIFPGISVEKKKKNSASWEKEIERGISLRLPEISSGYPSLK